MSREHVKVKIGYKKCKFDVEFTMVYREDPDFVYRGPSVALHNHLFQGYVWHENEERLHVLSVAVALINGRKNVADTSRPEGLLV